MSIKTNIYIYSSVNMLISLMKIYAHIRCLDRK